MKSYVGLNIQYPISELIASGKKTIETRTYPISNKYLGEEIVLIETPGKTGNFKARATAIFKVTECFLYRSKNEFYKDDLLHMVNKNSIWKWNSKPKYGWRITITRVLNPPVMITKQKGIIYTKDIIL